MRFEFSGCRLTGTHDENGKSSHVRGRRADIWEERYLGFRADVGRGLEIYIREREARSGLSSRALYSWP